MEEKTITLLETKEQALEAGVPEELFDPEVHLHSIKVEEMPPTEVIDLTKE